MFPIPAQTRNDVSHLHYSPQIQIPQTQSRVSRSCFPASFTLPTSGNFAKAILGLFNKVTPQPPTPVNMEETKSLLVTNAREEQRTLLQYVSEKELMSIYSCFDHPLQQKLVNYITLGLWKKVIEKYKSNRSIRFHDILKAAYCQRKISIEELATAYIFLAPAVARHRYKIYHFDEISSRFPEAKREYLCSRWKNIHEIPENLRYFVVVNRWHMDTHDRAIFTAFFEPKDKVPEVAGGIRLDNYYRMFAMGSAALIRSDVHAQGHPPVFIRGITPERKDLLKRIYKGLSDYAMVDPEERDTLIHTGKAKGLVPFAHDSFHLVARNLSGLLQRRGIIEKLLEMEEMFLELPPYSAPSIVSRNTKLYPVLSESASYNDFVKFVIEDTLSHFADGEVEILSDLSDTEVIDREIEKKFNRPKLGEKNLDDASAALNPFLEKAGLKPVVPEIDWAYNFYLRAFNKKQSRLEIGTESSTSSTAL